MQTGEYRSLVRRLRELRSRFLPALDPTGHYSDEDYDRVRALQLLADAEVEGYLEEAGKSVVASCSTKYHADSVARVDDRCSGCVQRCVRRQDGCGLPRVDRQKPGESVLPQRGEQPWAEGAALLCSPSPFGRYREPSAPGLRRPHGLLRSGSRPYCPYWSWGSDPSGPRRHERDIEAGGDCTSIDRPNAGEVAGRVVIAHQRIGAIRRLTPVTHG